MRERQNLQAFAAAKFATPLRMSSSRLTERRPKASKSSFKKSSSQLRARAHAHALGNLANRSAHSILSSFLTRASASFGAALEILPMAWHLFLTISDIWR
jgi:hypothetical protein